MNLYWDQDVYSHRSRRKRKPVPPLPPELYGCIFDYLQPLDIVSAGKVAKIWRNATETYFGHSHQKLLCRYFDSAEAKEFRLLQAKEAAVISGSGVIQFFQREFLPESDLDVYVEHVRAQNLGDFLERIEYKFCPRDSQKEDTDKDTSTYRHLWSALAGRLDKKRKKPYGMRGIGDVYDFKRGAQNIQLVTTRGPIMQVILAFHSSAVMNIMTASHAFSFYPKATFQEKRSLVITSHSGHGQEEARQKYQERGWRVFPYVTCHEATHPKKSEFAAGPRWVGDPKCMVVDLPPIDSNEKIDAPSWRSNSWSIVFDSNNDTTMEHLPLVSEKWKYSVVDEGLGKIMESDFVRQLLERFNWSYDEVLGVVSAKYYSRLLVKEDVADWFKDPAQHATLLLDFMETIRL